jgi:N-acetylglucosaminyldiphosphoundecaprenol N-acetyl-beta-D-mannosaminyltransferase
MHLMGVKIDEITLIEAKQKVRDFLTSNQLHTIFTPNPEMLVDAQKDNEFKQILNSSALNICDGKGIELVSKGKLKRIPGVDFMLECCKIAEEMNKSIYLLGSGNDNVIKSTVCELKKLYSRLKIVGFNTGPNIKILKYYNINKLTIDEEKNDKIIDDIILASPDILFVAFGHIKQEKWIEQFLPELPSVKIAMGVGGAFDYISGKVKRAPGRMRKIGLEWLWRLIKQPRRFLRIYKATILFLYLILLSKINRTRI